MEKIIEENKMENKEIIERKNFVELDEQNAEIIKQRLANIELIGEAIKTSLIEGIDNDYAVIPNTKKPSLLQPGAQKIQLMFGATTKFTDAKVDLENKLVFVKASICVCGQVISEATGVCEIGDKRVLGWEVNRAQAIAEKRAYVRSTVRIANLSKIFTVDMEDTFKIDWNSKIKELVLQICKSKNTTPKQVFEIAGIKTPVSNEKTYNEIKKFTEGK